MSGWAKCNERETKRLRNQVLREISDGHILWALRNEIDVVARDRNSDDILVPTSRGYYVVHLQWQTHPSGLLQWPITKIADENALSYEK